MNRFVRRGVLGAISASAAGTPLLLLSSTGGPEFAVAIVAGSMYGTCVPPVRGAYADSIMATASLGIPIWGITSVILLPLLSGNHMAWDAVGMQGHFAPLVGWILFGALLGGILQLLSEIAEIRYGPEAAPASPPSTNLPRIVILGGGFGGMKAAEYLEEALGSSASISLVSDTNALLFTPMLAEVAGSSLEPSHISVPLRSSLRRTHFVRGRVTGVDFDRRVIVLDGTGTEGRELTYDHVIFALGAVSNYLGLTNVERLAFDFKTLLDAIRIRNHVIEMFERADRETDPGARRQLLTFVIAGGGFAGVELAGALNDFAHGIFPDYRNLNIEELCVTLVHSRDRILPELSETLAAYALEKMRQRGVTFRLGARLVDAEPGLVTLSDGQIPAETLVWTAGTAPNPLIRTLDLPTNARGAITVDTTLAVPEHRGVWALGDCAAVMDSETKKPCPPTAQFALREAATIAKNICAAFKGAPSTDFHFRSLGALCVVGHQTACAELTVPFAPARSLRFSGLLAWFIWRGIYVSKLPGLERKIRVLTAWTLELFFPRDVIQTIELGGKDIHGSSAASSRNT
jgi:NADH:ubiquinone reductase (H+-translocating)